MIVKMATVFGLPVSDRGGAVSTQTLCQQVDNAIRKAKAMQQLEGVAETCVRGVENLKKELLALGNDRQDAQIERAVEQLNLATNMERIQQMFEDPTVSAEEFQRAVDAIQSCNRQVAQASNSIRAAVARGAKPLPPLPTRPVTAPPRVAVDPRGPPPPYTDTRPRAATTERKRTTAERISAATERAQGYAETGQAIVNTLSKFVAIGRDLSNVAQRK